MIKIFWCTKAMINIKALRQSNLMLRDGETSDLRRYESKLESRSPKATGRYCGLQQSQ